MNDSQWIQNRTSGGFYRQRNISQLPARIKKCPIPDFFIIMLNSLKTKRIFSARQKVVIQPAVFARKMPPKSAYFTKYIDVFYFSYYKCSQYFVNCLSKGKT